MSAGTNTTIEVEVQFGAVIKVGDEITTITKGAAGYTIPDATIVTANVASTTDGQRKITISKPATGGVADGDTLLEVTGNDIDAEKMSLGALADGFAVKVKGDTFKRSGIPNSRFEILQQGCISSYCHNLSFCCFCVG